MEKLTLASDPDSTPHKGDPSSLSSSSSLVSISLGVLLALAPKHGLFWKLPLRGQRQGTNLVNADHPGFEALYPTGSFRHCPEGFSEHRDRSQP